MGLVLAGSWGCASSGPELADGQDSGSGSATATAGTTATDSITESSGGATPSEPGTTATTATEEDLCGDRIIQAGEHCDDGESNGEYGQCNATCSALGPRCGDGIVNGPEPCDDGNGVPHDTCTNDCTEQACADGEIDPGELCFDLDPDSTSAGDPVALVAVDIDADTNVDLAVLDAEGAQVVVLSGDGTGAFTPTGTFAAAPTPKRMIAGLYDPGAAPDLATVGGGVVSMLLGDGAGGLQPVPGAALDAVGIGGGDLDGDGFDDLAVAASTEVTAQLAAGDGTFTQSDAFATDGFSPDIAVVAHLDQDGFADVAVALDDAADDAVAGVVRIYLGHGDGTLTQAADIEFPDDADAILALRLDADAVTDLAVLRRGPCLRRAEACAGAAAEGHPIFGEITILGGLGDGTFTELGSHVIGIAPRAMASGDFDADGNTDLVVVHRSYRWITALIGDGNGGFTKNNAFDAGFDLEAVAVADFNDDGVDDIAAARRETGGEPAGIRLLLSNP